MLIRQMVTLSIKLSPEASINSINCWCYPNFDLNIYLNPISAQKPSQKPPKIIVLASPRRPGEGAVLYQNRWHDWDEDLSTLVGANRLWLASAFIKRWPIESQPPQTWQNSWYF